MNTDAQLEMEIQAKGLTAPRITPADLEAIIDGEYYFTAGQAVQATMADQDEMTRLTGFHSALHQVTICALVLQNGTKVIGANTGPVSPENFDQEMARKLARQNATDQIWPMLGYELRNKLLLNGGAA